MSASSGPPRWGKQEYHDFPTKEFLEEFERVAFDPANAEKDLLVLMIESYATIRGIPLEGIKRWVEKTPTWRPERTSRASVSKGIARFYCVGRPAAPPTPGSRGVQSPLSAAAPISDAAA